MSSHDYDRFRQGLEKQLRADVELLFEAYQTKLRAYETVARARGELGPGSLPGPALELSANLLPPALAGTGSPANTPPSAPAAAPKRRPRAEAFSVHDAVEDALARLGETFDSSDLRRELGFEPTRSTLYRVLDELQQEGRIAIESLGYGRTPNRYRKVAPASPAPAAG